MIGVAALGSAAHDLQALAAAYELRRTVTRAETLQQVGETDAERGRESRKRIEARHGIACLQATQHGAADTGARGDVAQREILRDPQAPRDLSDVLAQPGALRVARTARAI